ncbi:MAG: glycosyltransferase [Bacilli bacterium]
MKKCDIIIPVYNSPEWVKFCVYALIKNTPKDSIGKIIIIDDCSDQPTKILLDNLSKKYKELIKIETNTNNLGFVKTCNKGLEKSTAEYVLLLNTDCLLSKNTIPKLIEHMENDKKIGLICPISSNAANLSLNLFDGFTYTQMNSLLEKKFKGKTFDACTVVGNCLMISKICLKKVGCLDEAYGTGYGEETDYQFKAMFKGFSAKVAIDTYVFHKSEVSFGASKSKQERLNHNRDLFFSRWKKQYDKELEKYNENDPIKYIESNISESDKKICADTLIYLPDLVQNAGGVHVVVDMVNFLVINNVSCNILYNNITNYQEIMLFNPINYSKIKETEVKRIVSTIYSSTYLAKKIADEKKIELISFIQGYENLFENGNVYGIVDLAYKFPQRLISISHYLQDELKSVFDRESTLIQNGIPYDLLHLKNNNSKAKTITMVLRNSNMKGDWLLLDILRKIINKYRDLTINIVYMNEYICFPLNQNQTITVNKYLGPHCRSKIYSILQETDIYIDASLNEGFGLMALEAMTAGAIPIVSNSFGILDYMEDNLNGFVIQDVNNSNSFINKLDILLSDDELFNKMKKNCEKTSKRFDYDDVIENYIEFFETENKYVVRKLSLTNEEKIINNAMCANCFHESKIRRKTYLLAKITPKGIKRKLKKIITNLYNMYQH